MNQISFHAEEAAHHDWLRAEARSQLDFFRASLLPDGSFDTLAHDGRPLGDPVQELHTTTRLVHSYALGKAFGYADGEPVIDAGMAALSERHHDREHGGYAWSVRGHAKEDGTKLAYGHAFVLLAGAGAKLAGHPGADRLIQDVADTIERHFWDESHGCCGTSSHATGRRSPATEA